MGITLHFLSHFDIRQHQNDQLVETNRMVLYLILLSFQFLTHFLLRGLTWVVLRALTQNHPQVVGTCPDHQPQPIGQNSVFKFEWPGPSLLRLQHLEQRNLNNNYLM